jgi:predicted MFS family arabinose efflux permease
VKRPFSPLIVKDVLHADAGQFGGVLTAFGIGGMLGPLLILLATRRVDTMRLLLTAGWSMVCSSWRRRKSEPFGHLGVLVGSGFLPTVANTSANTFLQSQANDQNRGQTASLLMLAMRGGLSPGNLATGLVISLSSVHLAFIVNGLLAIGAQAFIFRRVFRN